MPCSEAASCEMEATAPTRELVWQRRRASSLASRAGSRLHPAAGAKGYQKFALLLGSSMTRCAQHSSILEVMISQYQRIEPKL